MGPGMTAIQVERVVGRAETGDSNEVGAKIVLKNSDL